ncbi:MAG: crotonase/enoyl-CoA hydratase family protein [Pseudomonadota bacterium]
MKWLESTECIGFAVTDGVATITLNRPQKRNALNRQLMQELRQALLEADDLVAVHCVVIQGAGTDFCSGYDLVDYKAEPPAGAGQAAAPSAYDAAQYRVPSASHDNDIWRMEHNQADIFTVMDIHKPVIAKVHGHCLAGGTDLAFACDLVVVADDAKLGFPATRSQGSPPSHMWTYLVGPQWAKRLLLTGDLIRGADAARIGLAVQSVPAATLDEEVTALARRLALIDPDILAVNKRVVNMAMELMGARTLQRFAVENDARGHQARSNQAFRADMAQMGFAAAVRKRDAPFGDPFVKPN